MNPTAIYSKTGKGVQEASGKTSVLARNDRVVLQTIDGRVSVGEIQSRFQKLPAEKLEALLDQLVKDGFIRLVSGGAAAAPAPAARVATVRPAPSAGGAVRSATGEELDFTAVPAAAPATPRSTAAMAKPAGAPVVDSLLADLESFGKRDEEDPRAREEAEREAKAEAEGKARLEAERKARQDVERKASEEEARRRLAEAQRQRDEEARLRAQAASAPAARPGAPAAAPAPAARAAAEIPVGDDGIVSDDDIVISDDDLDMEDVRRDERALSPEARRAAREREKAPARVEEPAAPPPAEKPLRRRSVLRGSLIGAACLIAGLVLLHVVPLGTADYEKAASEALGVPVKIAGARLALLPAPGIYFDRTLVGDGIRIAAARAPLGFGALFGSTKSISALQLEGVVIPQATLGGVLLGTPRGDSLRVGKISATGLRLEGPLPLPELDVEATAGADGRLQSVKFTGPEKLTGSVTARGAEADIELAAESFTVPFVRGFKLPEFSLKAVASRAGLTLTKFDARMFDGVLEGNGRMRWGADWKIEGEVKARNMNVAVFAPALVSEGRLEGRASYAMAGVEPTTFFDALTLDGSFKVSKAVIGIFDLGRAMQTGGAETKGRTQIPEMGGKIVYDHGAFAVRELVFTSGVLNAAIVLDIDPKGMLAGRVVGDVKAPGGLVKGNLVVGGTMKDPTLRR